MKSLRLVVRGTFKGLLLLVILCVFLWQLMAVWYDTPWPIPSVAVVFLASLACFVLPKQWRSRLLSFCCLFLAILVWWLSLPPSNDRQWQADVVHAPFAEIEGDKVKIYNVRNFTYRSDTEFTPKWEERSYDLSLLQGVDIFMSDWGATGIVHTIVSWDFGNGQHLAISIETRKEVGETYSAVRGFFRQYELYYVVADERDLIGVRVNHRGEKVLLYRHRMPVQNARKFLLSYLDRINKLKSEPAWYNAFTANCTTTIQTHATLAGMHRPLNWRLFANKYADEMMYMRGGLNTNLPLDELRARSDVTERAREAGDSEDFATKIRKGLPERN